MWIIHIFVSAYACICIYFYLICIFFYLHFQIVRKHVHTFSSGGYDFSARHKVSSRMNLSYPHGSSGKRAFCRMYEIWFLIRYNKTPRKLTQRVSALREHYYYFSNSHSSQTYVSTGYYSHNLSSWSAWILYIANTSALGKARCAPNSQVNGIITW